MNIEFTKLSKEIIELSGKTMLQPGDFISWGDGRHEGYVRALIPAGRRPSECYPWLFDLNLSETNMNIFLAGNFAALGDRALIEKNTGWLTVFTSKL